MLRGKLELSPTVTIEVEAPEGSTVMDGQKSLIETLAFWQQIPTSCPMPGCGAPLVFFARHPKNFHYYGLVCTNDKPGEKRHEMNFGERKDGTTLYMKDDGWADAYGDPNSDEGAPAVAASKPAQTSPSGGQAGPKAAPALIASVMRKGAEKGMDTKEKVVKFINDCKDTFPWAAAITEVGQLSESQAKDIIQTFEYV